MQILVILAHPANRSFNHAIVQAVIAELKQGGHQIAFHDLYAEGFDPILPAAEIPEEAAVPLLSVAGAGQRAPAHFLMPGLPASPAAGWNLHLGFPAMAAPSPFPS